MLLNTYMLLIIYSRVGLTRLYIACLSCLLNVEIENHLYKREWKELNGDLHQPSKIRYVSISFSVRCLVSLAYRKGLIYAVTLSIVVPQAIGSFLCNKRGDHTGEFLVISFGVLSAFNVLELL